MPLAFPTRLVLFLPSSCFQPELYSSSHLEKKYKNVNVTIIILVYDDNLDHNVFSLPTEIKNTHGCQDFSVIPDFQAPMESLRSLYYQLRLLQRATKHISHV